jgi:DNA-binding MarR family transcriptional regulator
MQTTATKEGILDLLHFQPRHSGWLAAVMQIKQAGICRHLKELKEMGMVEKVEKGVWARQLRRSQVSSEELRTQMFDDLLGRMEEIFIQATEEKDKATLAEASSWIRILRDRNFAAAK